MPSKKQNKRTSSKYPALDPHLNLKTRYEAVDYDYINKLSDDEKKWLNNFTNEYVHAQFNDKKRIQKKKRVESDKNQGIKQLKKKLDGLFKNINSLINSSILNTGTKNNLKKLLRRLRLSFNKKLEKEKSFVNDVYKKEAYDRNNARNRCVLTRTKAQGKAVDMSMFVETIQNKDNVEDALIDLIDESNLSEKLKNTKNKTDENS